LHRLLQFPYPVRVFLCGRFLLTTFSLCVVATSLLGGVVENIAYSSSDAILAIC
jgi:hypothetical protein